jgi:hypothetical protein
MVLHYFLFPFKILVLADVLVGVTFKQKTLSFQKDIPVFIALPEALKSFFSAVFTCKYTSKYLFVNPYTTHATAEGRGGGGGGGGHGNDDWVIPNFSYHSSEYLFKKSTI